MGAGLYTCRQRYISLRFVLTALLAAPLPLAAQERVLERHSFADPEGRLLAFYSAALAFSPAGIAPDATRLSFQLELSYVPYLNAAQRRPTIDKPESTNLAPVFPRPRGTARFGSWSVDASWIPPLRLFDVEANVASLAVRGPSASVGALQLSPRLWGSIGRVKGAMTCSSQEMLGHGADLELYYATVCHNRESEDWFEPRMAAGEVVASRALGSGSARAYALVGARVDRTRFDIGVITDGGGRDADHPVLELRATRPHGAVGLSWQVRRGVFAGGELFYAPGSLLTVRIAGRWVAKP